MMKEEIFGPVVNINVFGSEDEVLARANATECVASSNPCRCMLMC